jgi:hypothetical protein
MFITVKINKRSSILRTIFIHHVEVKLNEIEICIEKRRTYIIRVPYNQYKQPLKDDVFMLNETDKLRKEEMKIIVNEVL